MKINELIDLTDKVAIVTGSSKGLGKAFAESLADAGADLVVNSRHAEELEEVTGTIQSLGRKVLPITGDVSKESDVKDLVQKTVDEFGKIDILINNAATGRVDIPPEENTLDEWNFVMNTNVNSIFMMCKEVGKIMIKQKKGKIINIGSICGSIVFDINHGGSYDVSKSAVAGLTKVLASEWARHNITVNAIAPGPYNTPANYEYFSKNKEFYDKMIAKIPLGTLGNLDEIGGMAVFLASDICNYMTGSTIVMDGGLTVW